MTSFSDKELTFRTDLSNKVSDSLSFVNTLKENHAENLKGAESCFQEISFLVQYFNYFTDDQYRITYDSAAEKIHSGPDAYFFINSQHSKPVFSTFQNAPDQVLSFLLNYALYEYNVRYDVFSFFHIKLDQIANKTYNRESEHDFLKRKDPECVAFVRELCLKQQYILHYLSNLETCKIRLRGDSCVANVKGVSFQLAWHFSLDRLVFTLSFAINNIFFNDYQVGSMSEFASVLKSEIHKNNFKTLFSKEQSFFLYQYLACHNHSIHLNEFLRFQSYVQKTLGIPMDQQEKEFIRSFDNLLNTNFKLGKHELKILPSSTYVDDPSRFFFSNGASIQITG